MRAILVVLAAVALAAVPAASAVPAAATDTVTDTFGGFSVDPAWHPGDLPPLTGCRDVKSWHVGRNGVRVDYEFGVMVHFCWTTDNGVYWRFTTIGIKTYFRRLGGTAKITGTIQKRTERLTCQVGPTHQWESRGCLYIVRTAQVEHSLLRAPLPTGHPSVAVEIDAAGGLPFWPWHNLSQW